MKRVSMSLSVSATNVTAVAGADTNTDAASARGVYPQGYNHGHGNLDTTYGRLHDTYCGDAVDAQNQR